MDGTGRLDYSTIQCQSKKVEQKTNVQHSSKMRYFMVKVRLSLLDWCVYCCINGMDGTGRLDYSTIQCQCKKAEQKKYYYRQNYCVSSK